MFYRLTTVDHKAVGRHQFKFVRRSEYLAGEANSTVVVRARTEHGARVVAADNAGAEGKEAWMDEETIVEFIPSDGPAELM